MDLQSQNDVHAEIKDSLAELFLQEQVDHPMSEADQQLQHEQQILQTILDKPVNSSSLMDPEPFSMLPSFDLVDHSISNDTNGLDLSVHSLVDSRFGSIIFGSGVVSGSGSGSGSKIVSGSVLINLALEQKLLGCTPATSYLL